MKTNNLGILNSSGFYLATAVYPVKQFPGVIINARLLTN